jgi:hypothetical protein
MAPGRPRQCWHWDLSGWVALGDQAIQMQRNILHIGRAKDKCNVIFCPPNRSSNQVATCSEIERGEMSFFLHALYLVHWWAATPLISLNELYKLPETFLVGMELANNIIFYIEI